MATTITAIQSSTVSDFDLVRFNNILNGELLRITQAVDSIDDIKDVKLSVSFKTTFENGVVVTTPYYVGLITYVFAVPINT